MIGTPTGPLGMELPSPSTRCFEKRVTAMAYVVAEIIKVNKTTPGEVAGMRSPFRNDRLAIYERKY
jgi:hypothetical protein